MHRISAALLVSLALPASADAKTYPGQRPADARTKSLVALGVDFWADRNVVGCPDGIKAWSAKDLTDIDTLGLPPVGRGWACEVWFERAHIKVNRRYVEGGALDECAEVVHEVGHALGLEHTDTGIMSEENIDVPWECRVRVRQLRHRH